MGSVKVGGDGPALGAVLVEQPAVRARGSVHDLLEVMGTHALR